MKDVEKKAVESYHSSSLYFGAGVFFRQIERIAKAVWAPTGLHPSHAHILLLILQSDWRMTYPTFLATEMQMSPSTITRLLEELEKKELITRIPYEHLMVINATKKARDMLPLLEQSQEEFDRRCYALLGKKETDNLASVLNASADALRAGAARARRQTNS
ncbi:MAG: winged helix-turn-helix transcriptional regulator [Bacteroidetes bacterium]|nr:winged helix-turn-helix transcriptional regulator [Bacteroidota bacterium]